MKGKSHKYLGCYLAKRYLDGVPEYYIKAFLIGCMEPDWNPSTYLKGSLRFQWLRGHNYRNARRLLNKFSRRLEGKKLHSVLDYYTLGKLIHYTADAFTYAHNEHFPYGLKGHRFYETKLQNYFLNYLHLDPDPDGIATSNIMETLRFFHREYCSTCPNVHTDTEYTLKTCCCVMSSLLLNTTVNA